MDWLSVALGLTADAGSNTWQGRTTAIRYRTAAFLTFIRAFSERHARPRGQNRVDHRVINLILYRAIARPAIRHSDHP